MAENTVQLRWIVTLYDNLTDQFRQRPDVFVSADLFWYPVESREDIRLAPDVLVVFGRPKGDRPSYRQWEEGNIPMTVVFEIVSPGNTLHEWIDKQAFYEDYGVEEYYILDPEVKRLHVFLRRGDALVRVRGTTDGFVSPRLGIRFDLSGDEIVVWGPGNRRFVSFEEIQQQREAMQQQRDEAQQQRDEAQQQRDEAREARQQAEDRARKTQERILRLAALSRRARQGQATPEELRELERLEDENPG
jgi:Uma2 family endonuclease